MHINICIHVYIKYNTRKVGLKSRDYPRIIIAIILIYYYVVSTFINLKIKFYNNISY